MQLPRLLRRVKKDLPVESSNGEFLAMKLLLRRCSATAAMPQA